MSGTFKAYLNFPEESVREGILLRVLLEVALQIAALLSKALFAWAQIGM